MSGLIGDISSMLGATGAAGITSAGKSNGYDLSMEDFLQLMIVQLTSQTIDDTMDTSEMMNQMVQMQMVTALANMTDISIQSYANSLVGQDVTVGVVNGDTLEERVIRVMGSGTYGGQQVIFGSDGKMYYLSQIMAVGILPDENGRYDYLGGTNDPSEEESYDYKVDDETTIKVYVGEDGQQGTEDDWYYVTDEDGVTKKVYVGADGKPGGSDDYWYDDDGTQGADT